jgi:hypothetical protein
MATGAQIMRTVLEDVIPIQTLRISEKAFGRFSDIVPGLTEGLVGARSFACGETDSPCTFHHLRSYNVSVTSVSSTEEVGATYQTSITVSASDYDSRAASSSRSTVRAVMCVAYAVNQPSTDLVRYRAQRQ